MKKTTVLLTALTLSVTVLLSGCNVTIEDKTNDEYKEKYDTLVSGLQSEYQEQFDKATVKSWAKTIYTSFAAYLTTKSIEGEAVPDNLTYDDIKEELKGNFKADLMTVYKGLDVEWEYNAENCTLTRVIVTFEGETAEYPEPR